MFLSCVDLDMTRRQTLKVIASPYRTHAAIEASFSSLALREDDDCRILWRIDDGLTADTARLYIVSPEIPLVHEVADRFGVPEESVRSKDYAPFVGRIQDGSLWRFRLKANPARKVLVDKAARPREGAIGSVLGHVTVSQQIKWLADRSGAHGFGLIGDPADVIVSHRAREAFGRDGSKVTLATAQFDGALRVLDADHFRHALGFGIGRAKGFGCGLMTIVPV